MSIEEVLFEFSRLMHVRLSAGSHTTEDSVRYTFFVALLSRTGVRAHEVILEFPHPTISGEIDTYIPSLGGTPTVIEFKYDRDIPSGSAVPKPQNAGELFADIYRLAKFPAPPEPDRFLVYCTDHIMAEYFRNPGNRYGRFFDLPRGDTMRVDEEYIEDKSTTFRKKIAGTLSTGLVCAWTEELPQSHHLRVYSVLPT